MGDHFQLFPLLAAQARAAAGPPGAAACQLVAPRRLQLPVPSTALCTLGVLRVLVAATPVPQRDDPGGVVLLVGLEVAGLPCGNNLSGCE